MAGEESDFVAGKVVRRWWNAGKLGVVAAGYLFLTAVLIEVLEPLSNPPGFTGRGAYAMGAIFLGGFHLAGSCRKMWFFYLFGGLGAILLAPAYALDSRVAMTTWTGYTTERSAIVGWVIFVLVVVLFTRMAVSVRRHLVYGVPLENPLCRQCGYDLRESLGSCSECGRAFDLNDPTSFVGTVLRWNTKWIVRRIVVIPIAIAAGICVVYGGLYCRSEQPGMAEVERLGGNVSAVSDLPHELQGFPSAAHLGVVERLFEHVEVVEWRGKEIHDADLACLRRFGKISEVHVDNGPITGAGFGLTGLDRLEAVYLPGSDVNDAGMAGIGKLWRLKQLQLSGTRVTDAGLEQLKGLTNLEALWLNGTEVTNEGLGKLAGLPKLEFVDVGRTKVTKEGVRRFRELRPSVGIDGP